MAIKLSGSISKKVPIEGLPYSSQSFGGSLEVEINSDSPDEIKERLHHLYESLATAVDAEIAQAGHGHTSRPAPQAQQSQPTNRIANNGNGNNGNGNGTANGNGNGNVNANVNGNGTANGNGRNVNNNNNGANNKAPGATEAQKKCIFAKCKNLGMTVVDALKPYGVTAPVALSISQASELIDSLKQQEASRS